LKHADYVITGWVEEIPGVSLAAGAGSREHNRGTNPATCSTARESRCTDGGIRTLLVSQPEILLGNVAYRAGPATRCADRITCKQPLDMVVADVFTGYQVVINAEFAKTFEQAGA
jgi:hypothetical protein